MTEDQQGGTTPETEAIASVDQAFVFANATLASEVDVKMRALWDLMF